MIVADTNLVVYLLVSGPLTPLALRVRAKEKIWVVPSLMSHELLNVLAQHVSQGNIERDEAARAWKRAISMVEVSLSRPDPIAILNMAEQSKCSTYDLEYVWLARELDLMLVTADAEILTAYPEIAISMESFASDAR